MSKNAKILWGTCVVLIVLITALAIWAHYSYRPAYIPASKPKSVTDVMKEIRQATLALQGGVRGQGKVQYAGLTKPGCLPVGTGSKCSAQYTHGQSVTLTATPAPGWYFAYWEWTDSTSSAYADYYAEANCKGASGTCTFKMYHDMNIRAVFLEKRNMTSG